MSALRRAGSVAALVAACLIGCGGAPAAREETARPPAAPPPSPSAPSPPAPVGVAPQPDSWAFPASSVRTAQSVHGMVTSTDPVASEVGAEMLRRGGNAVDAAVAVFFALAVVNPEAGNLGGGGFAVAKVGDALVALDFREVAPLAATRDMFLGPDGQPTAASREGPLSVGVPGSVAGMWALHGRHGALPWSEVMAPAIALADGLVVHARLASSLRTHSARLATDPATARIFLPAGTPPRVGDRLVQAELAATLRRVSEHGRDGFYTGRTAQLVAQTMRRRGGLITEADLARYQAEWREPVSFAYRDHRVVSMPAPSSGGATIAAVLQVLARHDVRALGWHSPAHLHLFAEACRRAFVERNAVLADPAFAPPGPMRELASEAFAARLDAAIDPAHAGVSAQITSLLAAGSPTAAPEGTHTTHFSVVDARGGAVAITTTLNNLYGAVLTVEGAGFLLNDEMDDFTARPGSPNMFGLVQGEANAVAPGKRMLSSMTPTIVLRADGRVRLVTGSPGGSTIITSVLQLVSNVIDFDQDLATATAGARVHHQHLPDVLMVERGGLGPEILDALRALGHTVQERATPPFQGDVQSILVREDGVLVGAADPRKGGAPVGASEPAATVH